ncbi:unnamed protein product [Brugia timori]|uniref:Uncharacterized protein n=1 Tax=Brugia timori TaxID=42155 RepID=A0A0R3QLW7_9BILA|nr:unnamed protein product [Brugia timori]
MYNNHNNDGNRNNDNCRSTGDMLLPISDAMSSEAINPTSLPSPSSGNILMLLNVLYTPGFVLHTPNLPLLNGYCV